jgi:hypothetical protein
VGEVRNTTPYHCQGDYEYWQERKRTYVPTPKTVLALRPVYTSSVKNEDIPWLWQVDKRETSIDITDWEMNTVPQQYCGAGMRRGDYWGGDFLDWCSAYGLTSWYAGHSHKTVTTVETNSVLRKITRANLKRLKTEFYEQKFLDIDCTKYTLIQAIKQIDWSVYDTIRLGSGSYSVIYDHIKHTIKDDCKIIVYKPSLDFIEKLKQDDRRFIENLKSVDYFAKD